MSSACSTLQGVVGVIEEYLQGVFEVACGRQIAKLKTGFHGWVEDLTSHSEALCHLSTDWEQSNLTQLRLDESTGWCRNLLRLLCVFLAIM